MSQVPAQQHYHALGLPAGSVRAIHVILVITMVCLMLSIPTKTIQPIPPYLVYLTLLMLGHFFASHGVTMARPEADSAPPLYIPPWLVRFLIIAALGGTIGYQMYINLEPLQEQFNLTLDGMKKQPFLPLLVLGAFFIGVLLHSFFGRNRPPAWLQNVEAWISLMALVGLIIAFFIHLVIAPSVQNRTLELPHFGGLLSTLVAFYFGARS